MSYVPNAHDAMAANAPFRLLLISADAELAAAAKFAAVELGARLDILPDINRAIAWLLNPAAICSHLLVPADLPSNDIAALAAMVDEVTQSPARILLLGPNAGIGPNSISLAVPDAAGIARAIETWRPFRPPGLLDASPAALQKLLQDGDLHMRFQPILDAANLRPVGLEMLLRLHHPTYGILRPRDFLSTALSSSEGPPLISAAVLRAVSHLQQALGELRTQIPGAIGLNTPLPTFCSPTAPERAVLLCEATGLERRQLVLELLETPTKPDLDEVAAALARWQQAGFQVVLDDAGPPLPHWRDMIALPFNGVKLDASLTANTAAARAQAAAITQAALLRGMRVVAEGIETDAQLAHARALGVQGVQGFLLARPLPTRAVPVWLGGV